MKKAAFFDFSGTLYAGSSSLDFVPFLWQKGKIDKCWVERFEQIVKEHRSEAISYEESATKVIESMANLIKGRDEKLCEVLVNDFFKQNRKRFFSFAKPLLKNFHQKGYLNILVSGDGQFFYKNIGKFLVFDKILPSVYEVEKGIFTGRVVKILDTREAKIKEIRGLVKELSLDLEASWAFGNAEADIGMMEIVGNPVAVNANHGLEKYAREKGWMVCQSGEVLEKVKEKLIKTEK